MTITIPLRTRSEANMRGCWRARHARTKRQRMLVADYFAAMRWPRELPPSPVVTLTRVAPRMLDDDNLQGSFKAIRDAVAKWHQVDDSPRGPVRWEYRQETGAYAVVIELSGDSPRLAREA
jgi:hypothetical protein